MKSVLSETEGRSLHLDENEIQTPMDSRKEVNEPSATLSARALTAFASLRDYLNRPWIQIVLLVLCGAGARLPALQGQLIWDDQYLAHDNPFIKSPLLIFETFRHYLFIDAFSAHYRPIQNVSYCLDYLIWNTNTYGYHLSNLLFHVGSSVLLYLLLRQLLLPLTSRLTEARKPSPDPRAETLVSGAAFLVALLWGVHPVHSAAVDYISGRADSLAFFFACGGWLLFLRAGVTRRKLFRGGLYGAAAASALLALCSRESACIWMLIFLFHLLLLDRHSKRSTKAIILAACLAIVGIYAGLRQLPQNAHAGPSSPDSPVAARAVLMLRALGDYGRLMIFPANLHMERTVESPEALLSNESWRRAITTEYLSLAGLLVGAGILYAACRKGPAQALRLFGAGWFFLAFLPISNVFPLNASVAEHWLYLPSVGFILLIVGCCLEFPQQVRRALCLVACFAAAALGTRSFVRSADWISPEIFYRHSLAAGASKIRMALNLSQIYTSKGDYSKAEPLLRKVLEMNPDYPAARNNLADLLFREGKLKEADQLFVAAREAAPAMRKEYPRTWVAALNVAHLYYREHKLEEAIATAEKATRDYPGIWELVSFEAEALREARGPSAATGIVEEFARQNWWHAGAALALGRLYSELGDVAQAEAAFRHASWLDIHDAESLSLIALMDMRQNHLQDAYTTQRRAISRQPDQPRQYLLLSDILQKMGRGDEARAAIAQVNHLQAIANSSAELN